MCIYREYEISGEKFFAVKAEKDDIAKAVLFEKDYFDTGVPYAQEDYEKVFRIGEILFIKDQHGEIIGLGSLTYGKESHHMLSLTENDAYYTSLVVSSKWRRKGIAKLILSLKNKIVKTRGVEKTYTCARANNIPSLKALSSSGFVITEARENFLPSDEHDFGARLILLRDESISSPSNCINKSIDVNKGELEIYKEINKQKGSIQGQEITDKQIILKILA